MELLFRPEEYGAIGVEAAMDTPDGSKVFFNLKGTFEAVE